MPKKKPAPDIYTWVLERMKLDAQNAIAFEDSGHGVTAAADAGFECIVVTTNGYTAGQDFSAASVVLDSLGEPDSVARTVSGERPAAGFIDLAYLRDLLHACGDTCHETATALAARSRR